MATYELLAALPVITLPSGATIRFQAIDPTTGAAVTGVTVSGIAIYDASIGANGSGLTGLPPVLEYASES